MSDAEYIKQLEDENELLKKEIAKYLEENWQSSPTLGLIEGTHFTKASGHHFTVNGKPVTCISRKFTSLKSMRDFIKSQSLLQNVHILFDVKENTIYNKMMGISQKMVLDEVHYILRFGVTSK